MRLTDGDPTSVALLEKVVESNRRCSDALGDAREHAGGFGATTVDAAMLLWGEHAPPPVPLSPAASGGDGLDERSTYDVRVATLVALPRLRCKRLSLTGAWSRSRSARRSCCAPTACTTGLCICRYARRSGASSNRPAARSSSRRAAAAACTTLKRPRKPRSMCTTRAIITMCSPAACSPARSAHQRS